MRFYFLGICGTAMGNVATMLKGMGHEIFGCDNGVYEPMKSVLEQAGIQIFEGYQENRMADINPDMVVVGNVMSRGNPEIEYLLEHPQFKYCSLPELLRSQILNNRKNIVVTGTHGKTTTTSIAAYLLEKLNEFPGYMIGGVPMSLSSGSKLGKENRIFAIEGDEYDSAFFDKRSKFIHYNPNVLIINNIEFDHADIFRDIEDVKRTFSHALKLVPRNGFVLANGDDKNIETILPAPWTTVYRVGTGKNNDLRILDYQDEANGSSFSLHWKEHEWGRVTWPMSGLYNARNAAQAVLAVSLSLKGAVEMLDLNLLSGFKGVKRRQELKYQDQSVTIIEDFGHHPTAIRDTIKSLRNRYKQAKFIACFEPRSYTSCSNIHYSGFRDAFNQADSVYIGPVYKETNNTLQVSKLAKELSGRGTDAEAFDSNDSLFQKLSLEKNPNKVVCFFTNGDFDKLINMYIGECDKKYIFV